MSPRKYTSTTNTLNPDPVLHRIMEQLERQGFDEKQLIDHLHLANCTDRLMLS